MDTFIGPFNHEPWSSFIKCGWLLIIILRSLCLNLRLVFLFALLYALNASIKLFFFGLLISIFRSCLQQVPEEIERVMVGVEAYLSIRKHVSDTGLSFFEDDDDCAKESTDKVFDSNICLSP
jgi:hypothetical protein